MNWLTIEKLLEQYWDGATSLSEEQQLRQAFERSDVPAHLVAFKDYFSHLNMEKGQELSQSDFEDVLLSKMYSASSKRIDLPRILAYAASFALLISIGTFFLLNRTPKTYYEPLNEKEFETAQKYLGLMANGIRQSQNITSQELTKFSWINKGTQTLTQIESSLTNSTQSINKVEYVDPTFIKSKYFKSFKNNRIRL